MYIYVCVCVLCVFLCGQSILGNSPSPYLKLFTTLEKKSLSNVLI